MSRPRNIDVNLKLLTSNLDDNRFITGFNISMLSTNMRTSSIYTNKTVVEFSCIFKCRHGSLTFWVNPFHVSIWSLESEIWVSNNLSVLKLGDVISSAAYSSGFWLQTARSLLFLIPSSLFQITSEQG